MKDVNSKIFLFLLLVIDITGCDGTATERIDDAQILAFQMGIKNGCVRTGLEKGDDKQDVMSFCSCMLHTLKQNITKESWTKATYSARVEKKSIDQIPEIMNLMPQVRKCNESNKTIQPTANASED